MAFFSVVPWSGLSRDIRIDPDYYHPEFLRQEAVLKAVVSQPLDTFATVSDGNHLSIAERFCSEGVRYLRGQDLSEFFVSDAAPLYIPESEFRLLSRSHILPGDVLLGIVGSIGSVSLVTERFERLTGNCKIAIIRPNGIPSEFLATWLTTKYGQNEIHRRMRGSVQMGVILPDVRNLPIPKVPDGILDKVIQLVKAAERYNYEILNSYPTAEREMLDRLGWQKLRKARTELFYIERFSDSTKAARLDPEHFQPQYQRLSAHLRSQGAELMGNLFTSCDKGTQPDEYSKTGDVIVVKSKNVLTSGIDLRECERTSLRAWSDVQARLYAGDLVLNSTGRGTLGRAAVVPQTDSKVVASVDLLICRFSRKDVLPEYIALFLNSPAGLAQSEQFQTGSSGQLHLYSQHLAQFLIHMPKRRNGSIDLEFQESIVAKVQAAGEARAKMACKLKEAKELVEYAIDKCSK